jgi:hypothetical protein
MHVLDEIGESEVQGHFWLHRQVNNSLGHIRPTRKEQRKRPDPCLLPLKPRGASRRKRFITGRKPGCPPRSRSALHTENSFPASIRRPGRWQQIQPLKNVQPARRDAWVPHPEPLSNCCHPACQSFREVGLPEQQKFFPLCV